MSWTRTKDGWRSGPWHIVRLSKYRWRIEREWKPGVRQGCGIARTRCDAIAYVKTYEAEFSSDVRSS